MLSRRMRCSYIALIALLLSVLCNTVLSQESAPTPISDQTQGIQIDSSFDNPPEEVLPRTNIIEEADKLTQEYKLAQEEYKYKEVIVLTALAVVSLLIVLTFMKINGNCRPRDMVTAAGLILIIFSTIILVLVAISEEQITAAIGVLGAIAGYLFGSASSRLSETRVESSKAGEKQDH